MPDLGPHASFIIGAYAVTFVAVTALTLAIVADDRRQRRLLAELERKGVRRRSATPAARPASAPAPRKKRRPPVTKTGKRRS